MRTIFSTKIIKAALLVGTLDIIAACISFYLKSNRGPVPVFKYIASGIFGKDAFTGGTGMVICGLLLHFLIAFIFTVIFFQLCDKYPDILNQKWVTGIVYGIFVWAVMNFAVLPLSNTPKSRFDLISSIRAVLILIVCIGIPLALFAASQKNKKQ